MNNPKILIVDDVEANLISLKYLLNEYFENVDVLSASSGEEALKISLSENINFIILDIQMPVMDGFETATFLKSNSKTKNIPIIFLTAAFKESEFQKKGFEIGAIDYLTKPINDHQLINKLRLYIEIFIKNSELKDLNATLGKAIANEKRLLKENQKQKHILQTILDSEQNLVIVTDYKEVAFVNTAFLEFFGVKNMSEYQEKGICLLDLLINDISTSSFNYIDADGKDNASRGQEFFKLLNKCDEADRVVHMQDSQGEKKSFYLSISVTGDDNDFHLFSFTDITKMRINQVEITKKAFYDGLTGVYNRNKFDEILIDEIKRATRYSNKLSCALIDIDHFKNFNDTYGHLIGDEILILLANSINSKVRETDTFARWGGEEFVLLFPDTALEDAVIIANKLRSIVEGLKHSSAGNVTASFGLTEFIKGDTIESMIKRCDEALYQAKASGRNCVLSLVNNEI